MHTPKRVAVITGAASGIGLALTKACLKAGMQVVMADIDLPLLQKQVDELGPQVLARHCDVSHAEDLKNLALDTLAATQRVDYLFNNAGISGPMVPLWELNQEDIRKVMEVNLYGVLHGIQAFLPLMFQQSHPAHIINMASLYGLCSGSRMAAYAMSKHAILALSESLYFDLQSAGKAINVSVVCPSFVSTQLLSNSMPAESSNFHGMLCDLMDRSRPAEDVADYILREVQKNTFYILPDKEVTTYCEQRTKAIVEQQPPYVHNLEKVVEAISRRAKRT